jgi:hypothetical protein
MPWPQVSTYGLSKASAENPGCGSTLQKDITPKEKWSQAIGQGEQQQLNSLNATNDWNAELVIGLVG